MFMVLFVIRRENREHTVMQYRNDITTPTLPSLAMAHRAIEKAKAEYPAEGWEIIITSIIEVKPNGEITSHD